MAGRVTDERAAERAAAAAPKRPERRVFLGGWPRRFIKEQPLGAFGGVVLLALVLVSIFAPYLAGHDPDQMTLADRLQGPSGEYPLGTDQLGRDFLSRLIYGARISLFVGLAATTLHPARGGCGADRRHRGVHRRHHRGGGVLELLGVRAAAGVPSWGGMLSREGRQNMEMAPRLAIWPGLCLTIVVYSINMFGDALRDLLDPRLRGSV